MKEFVSHLLPEGVSAAQFAAFYVWGLFGIILSFALDYMSSGQKWASFNFALWWSSNAERVIISPLVLLPAIAFADNIFMTPPTLSIAFIAGLSLDKVIEAWNSRRNKKLRYHGK